MKWILELNKCPLLTKENHLSQWINLISTRIDKTQTSCISHVNRLCALTFIHSWIYSCTLFTYLTLLYTFLYMFEIKCTLDDLTPGCIVVPKADCHSVHLEPAFPSLWLGMIRMFASAFCSELLPPLRWPGTCADFPAKSRYYIIRASCDDMPMMWGFCMMTFTSQLCQG